jgi:hypothetical protein
MLIQIVKALYTEKVGRAEGAATALKSLSCKPFMLASFPGEKHSTYIQ